MNSMERIAAVLAGEPTDRRAFTATLSLYGARLTRKNAADYYSDPELYAAGQRAVVDLCEPDILFGPFALSFEAEAFGAGVSLFPDSPPMLRKPAVKSAHDIASIKEPILESHPRLRYLVDSVQAVAEDQHGSRPVAGVILAPTDLPILLMGMENWIQILLFEPELAQAWARIALEHFLALAAAYFKAGATFLVSPLMMVNPVFMDPAQAERLVKPLLGEAFGQLTGPIVFHHGGTPIASILNQYKDLPHVAGFVLDEKDSFAQARQTLGPHIALLGNMNGPLFGSRTVEALTRRAATLLDDRASDPAFIFATSAADVPYDTNPAALEAVRKIVVEHS